MFQCVVHTPVIQYVFTILVLAGLVIYLGRFGKRSTTISWFRVFLLLSIVTNLVTGTFKCAPNQHIFSFAVDMYAMTGAVIAPVLWIFVFHFTNKERVLGYTWVRLLFLAIPLSLLYISWTDPLVDSRDLSKAPLAFGYHNLVLGPHSGIVGTIELFGYIAPIVMLIVYFRHIDDPLKRREVRLVIWGMIITVVPSIILEGFVQSAFHVTVFPIGPMTAVAAYCLITYALTKYGLRVLNFNSLSSDIMQVMPGGLLVLDHTNTIQYVNQGAADMLGRSKAQLAGTSAKRLFVNAADYKHFQQTVLRASTTSQPIAGEEIQLAVPGQDPLSVSINAVSVYAGNLLTNHLISFTDITPLKEAQAQLQAEKATVERKVRERTLELAEAQSKLTASIKSLPLGFMMIGKDGTVITTNPAIRKILHLSTENPSMPLLVARLGGYDLAALVSSCLARRASSEIAEMPVGARYLHLFVAPILNEHKAVLGAVILVEDITERKLLDRSKDEFFSIASHELRTPLASIRGNASLMINYYKDTFTDPQLLAMMQDVHASSVRLIGIVNDFLDVSRLEQGKMAFKPAEVDPAALIRDVETELAAVAQERHVKLATAPGLSKLPAVVADPDRLKQVIFNLVGNSLNFTEKGSITVSGDATKDTVTIHVTDTGRGMSPATQNLLFHKFQQGGASLLTRDTVKGTGLGLYISRLIVEGMGGKIWLEKSVEGKGSVFAFTLPVATPARLARAVQAAQPAAQDSGQLISHS